MIGFFPDPYPDELLYSACARYAERVKYPNKHMVVRDLFGKRGLSAVVDFPTRIGFFLSSIPNHKYSADGIINWNTLYPFYEPFITTERAKTIRKEMKNLTENHLQTRLATNIRQIKLPEFLRFCSLCANEDRELYGETYWHRLHQLAGILVCSKHKCFLQNSRIRWERESSYLFHSAENIVQPRTPKFLNDENAEHKVFLRLAQNAQWLLTQENLCLESGALRERYYNLLLRAGFAYYNGRSKNSKLLKAFHEYFPSKALGELGCSIESTHRSWVLRLIEKGKADVLHHPIRHLLLLHFLNISAEELFTSFVEFKPFGDGPYPCLNKSSEHFRELRILEYQIFDNISKDKNRSGRPLGVFACDCGFVYQRVGPDSSEQDRFNFSLVREYGETWENKLRELWMDLTLSTSKIGTLLGISQVSVVRHAIRLNLPMNTPDSRIVQGYDRHRNPNKSFSEMLTQYRQEWLKIVEENLEASRQKLMDISNFHYLWLRRNDSDWLEEHLPSPVKVPRKIEHLDWKKIDEELSRQIKEVCENLLSSKERPQRICITEIIKQVGYKKWIEKRHKKLPQTTKILGTYLESLEDYMIRKLRWAEKEFIKEKEIPTRNQLVRRAVIENTTTKNSLRVHNEINESLMRIRKEIEGS